jgi:hypothetical protein
VLRTHGAIVVRVLLTHDAIVVRVLLQPHLEEMLLMSAKCDDLLVDHPAFVQRPWHCCLQRCDMINGSTGKKVDA